MKLNPDLVEATFVRRLNRLAALTTCQGERVMARVSNSGRLEELLSPENRMLLAPVDPESRRKTAFDLTLVGVDGVLANAAEAGVRVFACRCAGSESSIRIVGSVPVLMPGLEPGS